MEDLKKLKVKTHKGLSCQMMTINWNNIQVFRHLNCNLSVMWKIKFHRKK